MNLKLGTIAVALFLTPHIFAEENDLDKLQKAAAIDLASDIHDCVDFSGTWEASCQVSLNNKLTNQVSSHAQKHKIAIAQTGCKTLRLGELALMEIGTYSNATVTNKKGTKTEQVGAFWKGTSELSLMSDKSGMIYEGNVLTEIKSYGALKSLSGNKAGSSTFFTVKKKFNVDKVDGPVKFDVDVEGSASCELVKVSE